MDKKHKGARNELIACAWLLAQGYEVFRNVSPHGDADVVTLKDGQMTLFDIKSSTRTETQGLPGKLTGRQVDMGVKLLHVLDTGECWIDWRPIAGSLLVPRHCARCKAPFRPMKRRQIYCSSNCRVYSYLQK